ncbi:phage integrase N-terminal SAM-like domain-containing protein [Desulfobacula sp.]|uniref:phage integrase N-terminal SAM-like domain-containing protein n=1 Tax=Desulfobacula sp. TaxID=2593537 RepID=UPI00261AABC5|nr:phage integrase N-terminal SAM-like domain-containing protein [Desulfobacula sp.]
MKKSELNRFNRLYKHHLRSLKLQRKAQKTIEAYSRAIRRVRDYFDCCPDKLKPEQLEEYFTDLVYRPCLIMQALKQRHAMRI